MPTRIEEDMSVSKLQILAGRALLELLESSTWVQKEAIALWGVKTLIHAEIAVPTPFFCNLNVLTRIS